MHKKKNVTPVGKINTVIMGCGNIGAMYDFNNSKQNVIISHLKGYLKNRKFNLHSIIDKDKKKLDLIKNKYSSLNTYTSIKKFKECNHKVDVVSICTPTKYRYEHLMQVAELNPKLIFCEKPLSENLENAKEIVKLCKSKSILLVVNYFRRWDPFLNNFKKDILKNRYGELQQINATSNNGILNYGCHLFDLLSLLFEKLNSKDLISFQSNKNFINILLCLKYKNDIPITISISNEKSFSLFEIEFIFSKYIIKMFNGGRFWGFRKILNDKNFSLVKVPSDFTFKDGKIYECMPIAINNISNVLENNEQIVSDGQSSIKSQEIFDKIVKKLKI